MSIEVSADSFREAMQTTVLQLINENIQLRAVVIELENALKSYRQKDEQEETQDEIKADSAYS